MNKYALAAALVTLAIPSVALAASTDQHQQAPNNDGCCPDKKDGEKKDDCCKGGKCCDSMKSDKADADAHADHPMTH